MKALIKISSLVLLLLMMAGCQKADTTEEEATTIAEMTTQAVTEVVTEVATEPVTEPAVVVAEFGGQLRIAMSPATSLNPLENKVANVAEVLDLVYEPLFVLDNTLLPQPVLVESYTYELEGRSLTLVLKEGVLFQNETPLTASDVAYTIDAIKDLETSPYKPLVLPIKRVSVLDERTLTLYYDEPYAFMLNDLTFPILSKTYLQSGDYDPMVPMGTGPYGFVDYQVMQSMDLTANPLWHGGQVYVENIHVVVMNETSNLETLFDQHLIDLMNPDKFNWLKYSDKEDQQIESYLTTNYDFIGFNFENDLLQIKGVRQGIAYAIDRDNLIYNQFINHATLVDTPVIPGSWFETEAPLTYTYDLEMARELASDVPWSDQDGDGLLDKVDVLDESKYETIQLVMLVNGSSSVRTSAAPIIAADIQAIGIDVVVEVVDSATYYERVLAKDFDLLYGGWQLSTKPDYVGLFTTDGAQNYFGYASEEMDFTLASLVSAYDQETVKERVAEFETILKEDMPYVSLYFLEGAVMSRDKVHGQLMPSNGSVLNHIEALYLDLTQE